MSFSELEEVDSTLPQNILNNSHLKGVDDGTKNFVSLDKIGLLTI
jgi:hypothetical protein